MAETFPKPEDIFDITLDFPGTLWPPCMLSGLKRIIANKDMLPGVAMGTYITGVPESNTKPEDDSVLKIPLYCAARAVEGSKCTGIIKVFASNEGIIPRTGAFSFQQLAQIDCPRRSELE